MPTPRLTPLPPTRPRRAAGLTALIGIGVATAALPLSVAAPAQAAAVSGAGTSADPFRIASASDFHDFVEAANTDADARSAHWRLEADIELTDPVTMIQEFSGTLDGAGHVVKGLVVDPTGATDRSAALLNVNNGEVREIGFTDVAITGNAAAESQTTGTRKATVALDNRGTVDEVMVQGRVDGGWRSGGLVADNFGTISDSYFRGAVVASWEVGGIAARNDNSGPTTVAGNYVDAEVTTLENNAGLITAYGYDNTTIERNVALGGSVSGKNNIARITGRLNTAPVFRDNLALDSLPVNGASVTGTATTMHGADRTAAQLAQQATWEAIGWDFVDTWAWDAELARPVLQAVPEPAPETDEPEPDSEVVALSSPDDSVSAEVFVAASGQLRYRVEQDSATVVAGSDLGLEVDDEELGRDVTLGTPSTYEADETYPLIGTHETGRDHYRGVRIPVLDEEGAVQFTLDVRAYDTGIAFAYELPEAMVGATVRAERTTVQFAPTDTMWFQESTESTIDDLQNSWSSARLSTLGERRITVLPTVEVAGGTAYVNVTEADQESWPALELGVDGTGEVSLHYWATDAGDGTFPVPASRRSPWRVLTVAADLDELSSSDIVTAVNDPMDPELFADAEEWIEPGTSVWMPLNGAGYNSVPEDFRTFITSASAAEIPYVLVEDISDASWGTTTAEKFQTLEELAELGAAQPNPVKLWMWSDYDHGNGTDEAFVDSVTHDHPGGDLDSLVDPHFREAYLDLLEEAGIAGIKIDHLNEETESKVDFYEEFNRSTAERKMMVIYHNPLAPSGLNRTWPHELTREAIRGVQYQYDAWQNAVMPFTRLVAGAADYTPLTFSNASKLNNVTRAHMMASTLVYTSPYLQLSEVPTTIEPGGRFDRELGDFVANLPTEWKTSTVLPESEIGELAAVMRESKDGEYWIAAQAAPGDERTVEVDLDFLPEGTWNVDTYADGRVASSVQRTVSTVSSADSLQGTLAPGGGWVVRITEAEINDPGSSRPQHVISSEDDLELMREHPAGRFTLSADITLTEEFTPIPYFTGTLDGAGHVIRGLRLEQAGSMAFIIDNSGTITDLGFVDVRSVRNGSPAGANRMGVVAVVNSGEIDQVYVDTATVSGGWRAGGLVAENYGAISNVYSTDVETTGEWEAAGLVAWNSAAATLENSWSSATVTSKVNNAGVVSGYGYEGTEITGTVALAGSVTGQQNLARINGRENGVPTYAKNIASESITVNGATVTGVETDKQGRSVTASDLARAETYAAIGWDMSDIWAMHPTDGHPVLRNVADPGEVVVAPEVRLSTSQVIYRLPTVPDEATILADLGARADRGTLRLDLSGADLSTPGRHPAYVSAVDGDSVSLSRTVEIVMLAAPEPEAVASSVRLQLPTKSAFGATRTLTATVSTATSSGGTPTGSVQFRIGDQVVGSAPVTDGRAVLQLTTRPGVGRHRVTASFLSTDATVLGSTAGASMVVTRAGSKVRAALPKKKIARTKRAKLRVRVVSATKAPLAGKIVVRKGKKVVARVSVRAANGRTKQTLRLPRLARGNHKIRVTYTGGADHVSASSKRLRLRVR